MEGVSPEGRATIITCGLNRKPLVDLRLKVVVDLLPLLHHLHAALRRRDLPSINRGFEQLARLGARSEEFTGMVRWFTERVLGCYWERVKRLPD